MVVTEVDDSAPRVLIRIKRFTNQGRKKRIDLEYNTELVIQGTLVGKQCPALSMRFCHAGCRYELTGIIEHIGWERNTLSDGKFISWVKNQDQ